MAENGNIQAHEATYKFFINMFKVGMVVVALITALVIYLIAG